MYYFTHPQAYHMRPIDPVVLILACYALVQFVEPRPRRDPVSEELMFEEELLLEEELALCIAGGEVDEGVEVGA